MTPDWVFQLMWFIAGVGGTGAVWYFLAERNYHALLWTVFATVVVLFVVALHIRNNLLRRDQQAATLAGAITASAIERVRHDNVHGRVCLAICGSWSNTDAPASLIDGLVDGLARMVSEHPLHVIHGPRGVGIEVVNRAVNDYQASTLTFTVMVGPQIQIVAPAE